MKKVNKIVSSLMICSTILTATPITTVLADEVYSTNEATSVNEQATSTNDESSNASLTSDANSVENNNGESVQKHALSKPYVVYGSGLSQSEQQQVGQVLGVTDSFETLTANADDYRTFIDTQSSGTTNSQMISSVALEPTDEGSGVKVSIKNFDGNNNITQVTAQQYAMVATLAGVKDMNIIVTSPREVSGTSALTGVYVALQKDGITLNNQNTSVANDMLNATQQAVSQNGNDPKYAGQLSNAVMNTAQTVAQNKQDGNNMNQAEVQKELFKNLKEQGIENKTPQLAINNITNVITNEFQNAPVAKSKTFVKNASNTVDNIKSAIKNGNKQMFNTDEFKKNLPSENWFVSHWNAFVNWLKSLFQGNKNTNDNSEENNATKTANDNQKDELKASDSSDDTKDKKETSDEQSSADSSNNNQEVSSTNEIVSSENSIQ